MKLVIQIPALNEEVLLPHAIAALPRRMAGFGEVAILVIDDGSTDGTAEVARRAGADRIVRFATHHGLAAAFRAGLEEALDMGADVIVNFDADLQYDPADIPALIAPLLADQADIVIGDRSPGTLAHFSLTKRLLQRFGSWMVRQVSGLAIHDATSGFRAFSREAARRLNVFSKMTYTLETLIQAGFKNLRVASVPVAAHPVPRASRLLASPTKYVLIQAANILRISALYKPLKIFSVIGALFCAAGVGFGLRVLFAHLSGDPAGHLLALYLSALLIVIGVLIFLMALLADLMAINREFLEELKLREGEKLSAVSLQLSARREGAAIANDRQETANR
jgi:glycosyltransferase involved in cell wall biosynthesis